MWIWGGSPALPQSQILGAKASQLLRGEGKPVEAAPVADLAQGGAAIAEENALEWVKNDKRRMLHVVYRVGDLDKTIKYVSITLCSKYNFNNA